MAASNRARIEAYVGASGSGKGLSIKRRLSELSPSRLMVWDAKAEYAAHARQVATLGELVRQVRAAGAGPFRLRYVPGSGVKLPEAFAIVCKLAYEVGGLVLLAEELSDVTSPSWSHPAWRQVITQGRHEGLHVLGAAQRPSMVDKTFLGNCTRIRCGALGYPADRRAMADALDCDRRAVEQLESVEFPNGGAAMTMLELDKPTRAFEHIELRVTAAGRVSERRADATSARNVAKLDTSTAGGFTSARQTRNLARKATP